VTDAVTVEAAVADAHRREWAAVLAATVRVTRDLDLAEECVQDAYAAALRGWPAAGVPGNPAAWLTITARRRAIDAIRRDAALRARLPLLVVPEGGSAEPPAGQSTAEAAAARLSEAVPDERLRLIFICCHPALAQEAQVALTLRLVCGMSVPDIARAFLISEPTMAARITRAKKKISVARIPYAIPRAAELSDRLTAVLAVVHLLYTAGHTAPSGPSLVRADLVEQAMHLTRMLRELMPDSADVRGLHALLLVTDARRATRTDADGRLLRLSEQDRSRWDSAALAEAHEVIVSCLRAGPPGRYVLQAAIAALYAEAPSYDQTDWPQIVELYDRLLQVWPSPVVALNRAVPLAMVVGPQTALAEVERLNADGRLSGYQYLHAIRADLLSRLGRGDEAAGAYQQALALTTNDAERAFLSSQGAAGAADDACLGWKLLRRNLSDGHRGVLFGMAKVLFVVTGATYLVLKDGTRYATGYWAEEFANPYKELTDAGHEVVVATPGGVTPNVDMMSLRPSMAGGEQGALDLEAIIRSAEVLRRPLKVSDVRPEDYDAIYFPGGHGPMQDLAFDADVGRLLTAQLASGRPLAIVCHAPAAILSTRIGGVSPFKGYRVTCFTNDEEEAVGLASKTQWLLETELKEKVGVQFSRGALWEPFMVEDRNLITGQNPHSAAVLGERLLKVLG
jgi:RNA polymerase sigma factor (sigma-70 family)